MKTIIYGGSVFAGLGEHLERDHAILVKDDKIDAVGPPAQLIDRAFVAVLRRLLEKQTTLNASIQ